VFCNNANVFVYASCPNDAETAAIRFRESSGWDNYPIKNIEYLTNFKAV
jgi:hypothetical protein